MALNQQELMICSWRTSKVKNISQNSLPLLLRTCGQSIYCKKFEWLPTLTNTFLKCDNNGPVVFSSITRKIREEINKSFYTQLGKYTYQIN